MPSLDRRYWRSYAFAIAVGISAVCLIFTHISAQFARVQRDLFFSVADFFSFSFENNFGAWWSSTVLFVASLQALDRFTRARDRRERGQAVYPWLAVSAICLVLSIDEGASIHERIGTWMGVNMWEASAPFGFALLAMFVFAVYGLWRDKAQRAASVWLTIAVALFSTVMVQEHLEFATHWWGHYAGFRASLEEGTEILAMLILLRMTMGSSIAQRVEEAPGTPPMFDFIRHYRRRVFWTLLLLAPLIAHVSAVLPDQNRGRPAAWAASVIFLLCALTLASMALRGAGPFAHSGILALIAGAMSLQAFVLPSMTSMVVSRRLIAFGLTFLLFVVIQFSESARASWPAKLIVTAFAGILVVLPFANPLLVVQNLAVLFAGLGEWFYFGPASDE